jgi:hypothetical protein
VISHGSQLTPYKADGPGVGRQRPGGNPQQGRLALISRTHHRNDFAGADG